MTSSKEFNEVLKAMEERNSRDRDIVIASYKAKQEQFLQNKLLDLTRYIEKHRRLAQLSFKTNNNNSFNNNNNNNNSDNNSHLSSMITPSLTISQKDEKELKEKVKDEELLFASPLIIQYTDLFKQHKSDCNVVNVISEDSSDITTPRIYNNNNNNNTIKEESKRSPASLTPNTVSKILITANNNNNIIKPSITELADSRRSGLLCVRLSDFKTTNNNTSNNNNNNNNNNAKDAEAKASLIEAVHRLYGDVAGNRITRTNTTLTSTSSTNSNQINNNNNNNNNSNMTTEDIMRELRRLYGLEDETV